MALIGTIVELTHLKVSLIYNDLKLMKQLIFACLAFSIFSANAQDFDYTPSKSNIPSKRKFEERMEENLLADVTMLEGRVKNKKEVAEIFAGRAEFIHLMAIDEDEYIFNTPLNEYVQTIFDTILAANPQINVERTELFIARDIAPNASCFGEGTMVINASLIRRLENESQIAFVLAHELAHYTNDHVNTSIIDFVEKKNDRNTQKEIKRITKQKYNRNKAGLALLKSVMYNSSKHIRLHESEADEKAVELLLNTPYDVHEAPKALALLDTIDEEKYSEEIVIHREFNRPLYPFKPEWTTEENPLEAFFDKESQLELLDINADSLKTHPDCIKRAENIAAKLADVSHTGKLNVQSDQAFMNAVQQADFDLVLSAYHYENYGYAIYQSLQLQKKYPEHPFLVGIIGACMGEMVRAIDKHELGKVLSASSPEYDDNYNDLLKFLNNLSMKEMKEVGWNYVAIYQDKAAESEALAYALAITAKMKKKEELKAKYKQLFFNKFPSSYFVKKARKV